MINSDDDLEAAIGQLGIETDGKPSDRQQLTRVLFDILGYPMIEDALLHERANLLGENDLIRSQQIIENQIKNREISRLKVCRCCGILQQHEPLQCCTSLKEINIGVGVRLYFMSLSYHTVLFIIATLIYSVYSMATNISLSNRSQLFINSYCLLHGTCGIAQIGVGPKVTANNAENRDTIFIQLLLSIVVIVVWGIINIIRMHNEKLIQIQSDEKRSSAANFTLLIQNFPKIYLNKSKHEINKEFNRIFKNYQETTKSQISYEVVKVNIGRPLFNVIQENSQRKRLLTQELQTKQNFFRNLIQHRRGYKQFPISLKQREAYYQEYIQFYIQKFDTKQTHQVELQQKCTVFVTMKSSKARQQIAKLNEPSSLFNFFRVCRVDIPFPIKDVIITNAPEPEEIIWQNIGFTKCNKFFRRFLIYLVAFLLISISLGISIGLGKVQTSQKQAYISVIISIVITLINFIIQYVIQAISFLQNQFNKTAEQASIAFKIGLSQLLNSVGVPIVVAYIAQKKIYESGGLGTDVFFLALFNLATPIGRFIDPYYIYLKLKKVYYNSPDLRLKMYGQQKLNKNYASYEMELGYEYSYIIRTVIFTSFFMCLQPIIALFAPIGLILMYLVNKYRIYYRFHRPKFHTFQVNDIINWMVALGPTCFVLGHLYCLIWVKETKVSSTQIQITIWISLAIACFLIFFCFKIFFRCFKEAEFLEQDYFEKKALLKSDYDLLNPVTRQSAISEMQNYFGQLENLENQPNQWELLKPSLLQSSISAIRISSFRNKLNSTIRNQLGNDMSYKPIRDMSNKHSKEINKANKGNENIGSRNNKQGIPRSQLYLGDNSQYPHYVEDLNHYDKLRRNM